MERNLLTTSKTSLFLIVQLSNTRAHLALQKKHSVFSGVLSTKINTVPHNNVFNLLSFPQYKFFTNQTSLQLFKVCKQVPESPRPRSQFKLVNVSPSIKFQLFHVHKEIKSLLSLNYLYFIIQPAMQ